MKRKTLILLVCFVLVFSMALSACSSGGETSSDNGSDTEQNEGTENTENEELETFSFSVMLNDLGADAEDSVANTAWLEKMEELMGMKIDIEWNYTPNAEYDDKMKILLSGGDLPDYFLLPFLYDYTQMANEGFFLDLSEYDMPNYLKFVEQAHDGWATAYMDNGMMPVVYGVTPPIIEPNETPIPQTNAMYNYTAFEREGIKIPETLDELYEAAKQFKEKYPESYPINVNYGGVFSIFGAYHTYANLDGAGSLYWDGEEYTFAGLQPEYKKGVEFLNKLYSEGLFDPEYIIDTVDTIKTKMLNEDNFMLMNSWRTHATEYTRDSNYETTFVSSFYPDEPEYGKAYQEFSRANEVLLDTWAVFAMNSETENPELLTKFVDLQYTPEVYEINSWGVEDVTYTVDENGEKKYIDEFFEGDDPARVCDKYGLWNDRSGRVNPGLRNVQYNVPREVSFPVPDYTHFGGKYEEAPMQQTEFFQDLEWPNEYIPPRFNTPTIKLTKEENDEVSTILTQLTTYTAQMQAEFISGELSLDEWDSFMDTFQNSYDLQRVLDIHNDAAERYFEQEKEQGIE